MWNRHSVSAKASVDNGETTASDGISLGIVVICVSVVAFAAYYNSFGNSFQLDDFHIAVDNPWIRSLKKIPRFFIDPYTFSTLRANADYRPFLSATYALNYAISRYNPWSWHVLSLVLHIAVAVSLFLLGRTLFGGRRIFRISWLSEQEGELISLGAAILFALHPANTAMINYMSARSSLLVTAFVLPATVLYLRAMPKNGSFSRVVLAASLYILAMLTKVEAVSLLGVLYVAELLFRNTVSSSKSADHRTTDRNPNQLAGILRKFLPSAEGWRRLLPFALLTVAYLIIRLILLPPGVNYAWGVPVFTHSTYLLTQFRTWWYYIGQLLAPVYMIADYAAYPASTSLLDPRVLYALAGWTLVATLLVVAVRSAPSLALLGLAYFIHLSPHSSVLPISEMVNEHRPYLPTTGLFLMGMVGIFLLVRRFAKHPEAVFAIVVFVLAIPLGALTHERNKVWKNEETLWADTVSKNPESTRAQMNYGLVLMARGQYQEAEARFTEAVRLAPFYNLAHINLAIVLAAQDDPEDARKEYDTAVQIAPSDPKGYYWRGLFLSKQGDLAGAISNLQQAVALSTVPTKELEALAETLVKAGRMKEANEAIDRGASLDPEHFNEVRQRLLFKSR